MSPTFYRTALEPVRRSTFICRVPSTPALRTLLTVLALTLISFQWIYALPPGKDPLTVTGKVPTGVATESYSASITASGGTAPYTYKAANLPKGLAIDNSTGAITGTCNSTGEFSFSIYVTDSSGKYGNGSFTVTFNEPPVSITLAPGTVTIPSGGSQQMIATVLNTTNTNVTYTTTAGSISSTGSFTAPKVTSNTKVTITATSVADTTKSATSTITVSTAALPPVTLELVFPPTNVNEPYYNDVQSYLLDNPTVGGVVFWLEWSSADNGPSGNPQYDFSTFDAQISPWIAAGKKVNIIVWPVSDLSTNTATPSYVMDALGSTNITTCAGEKIPNYFQSAFQLPYQAFMAQVVKHYEPNGSIGYIRIGLARGGETWPAPDFGTDPCTTTFTSKWGWTDTTWTNYVNAMLNYEATLKSTKQLMVGIDSYDSDTMPESEAATAVSLHIAFGNEGMNAGDITNFPHCSSDWCDLFAEYTGDVPLELQSVALSSPEGAPPVGSLVTLLPFAVQNHATILEIYCDDWLLAFDPNYPGNSTYGAAYAAAFKAAALGK